MGVLGTWMQNGRKESPRELMEIIRLQISMLDESTLPAFEAKTGICHERDVDTRSKGRSIES